MHRTKRSTLVALTLTALVVGIACTSDSPSPTAADSAALAPGFATGNMGNGNGGGNGKGGGNGGGGSAGGLYSLELSGGFTASLVNVTPKNDNKKRLGFDVNGDFLIDFPSLSEADCTFSEGATQADKDRLLALVDSNFVADRQMVSMVEKQDGVGFLRINEIPGQVGLCWSTGGFCAFDSQGTDIDDPSSTRNIFFSAAAPNNAVRLVSRNDAGDLIEAICENADDVLMVLTPQ